MSRYKYPAIYAILGSTLLLLPFFHLPFFFEARELPKQLFLLIASVALFVLACIYQFKREKFVVPSFLLPFSGILISAGLSTALSRAPAVSLFGSSQQYGFSFLSIFIIILFLVSFHQYRKDLSERFIRCTLLGIFGLCALIFGLHAVGLLANFSFIGSSSQFLSVFAAVGAFSLFSRDTSMPRWFSIITYLSFSILLIAITVFGQLWLQVLALSLLLLRLLKQEEWKLFDRSFLIAVLIAFSAANSGEERNQKIKK
jgi:hypothetical protein